jgi:hypothetical protein
MRETLAFDAHRKSRTSGGLKVDALVPQVFWNATAPQHLRALGDPRSNIARMRARERSELTGPGRVLMSAGSPTRIDAIFALNFFTNVG